MERKQYCYPFPRPAVTADVACIAEEDGRRGQSTACDDQRQDADNSDVDS